jgi:predicted PurR-regulated permease PerM
MSRLISFAVLIAIIIVIGLLFYRVLIGFFVPVFLAAVLVVVFRPLHRWVLEKSGQRARLAAVVSTLLIMLALFLPFTVVAVAATLQGLKLLDQNDAATLLLRVNKVRDSLGLKMPPYEGEIKKVQDDVKLIIRATEETREASGALVTDEENARLKMLGSRTIANIERLELAVRTQIGDKWEKDFDDLIVMTEQVGQPSDIEFSASTLAVDLKSRFADLKTDLLGGAVMALARETANPTKEDMEKFASNALGYLRPKLLSITGATGSFVVRFIFGSVILIVATFFFLYDGPGMLKSLMFLSPLDDAYEQELLLEFDRISRAVVLATILSAIVQGLTAGLGYFVAGMDYLALLIMLTTVFAMVPFVGPAVVWVPVCLYLALYKEHYWSAGLLAAWGVLVVGTVDNFVKAFVLHGQSQLHPLFALLSVLGGVQTLGPIGIVVGPMVVTMLQTLLSILQRELLHFEKHDLAMSAAAKHQPRARFKLRKSPPSAPQDASGKLAHRKRSNAKDPKASTRKNSGGNSSKDSKDSSKGTGEGQLN